ncbi:UNVERIFIED_CONTAM: Ger(x)C family spore germination protein [Halobacillus marinus]|uniref:Ger(x)C family spore germination protein n=1 Tax=Bacillaceae TaxID=186817 RepID=UPI0002A51C67|nr:MULTISPECIES: Ger(x)C family spore germination protein [Bacillaceae]ELK47589.1 spore germination protein [Halobacillus sp. BAB-2008]QHT45905.1 Ger(x)C family spore germination protein [Bacillus sp. SB49]
MKKWVILSISLLLLCGCIPKSYIEQLGIITAVGYDLLDDQRLRGTMVMYEFDPTATGTSQVVSAEAETSKGLRAATDHMTSHKLVSGQVRLELFQDKLAANGMMKYMDTLQRDAKISDMGYLAVSTVPTSQLLQSNNSEDKPNTGTYIQRLIEKSIKDETIPNALMTFFMREYYDDGIDPVLPVLSMNQSKAIIQGVALFQDDRFVSILNEKDVFYLMLMKNEFEFGEFQIELPSDSLNDHLKETGTISTTSGKLLLSLHELDTDKKVKVTKGDPTRYTMEIDMKARLLEITKDIDLKEEKAIEAIEKELEQAITKRLKETMEIFKELQVDPVGFGAEYNSKNRTNRVKKENWKDQIQDLNVEFKVNFRLVRYGISE